MKKSLIVLAVFVLLALTLSVGAAPAGDWLAPEEGAVEMFRLGDRAFGVGADSGGAGIGQVETEKLLPSPGGEPIPDSKCAMNVETCSGSCVAYLNYYCKPADCKGFKFC